MVLSFPVYENYKQCDDSAEAPANRERQLCAERLGDPTNEQIPKWSYAKCYHDPDAQHTPAHLFRREYLQRRVRGGP